MTRRRRTLTVLITSAAAATTFGLSRLIHREHATTESDANSQPSLKKLESKLHLTDDLLKNNDDRPYISVESTDPVTAARYQRALLSVRQSHSHNNHVRERGLSHLAKLDRLPSTYYSIIGQQLDSRTAIQLARTCEANTNLFPSGPPYIFSVGNKKVLATDNVENFNDDDVLLHTIREFLDKLVDNAQRPLDILSNHYLTLVRQIRFTTLTGTMFR